LSGTFQQPMNRPGKVLSWVPFSHRWKGGGGVQGRLHNWMILKKFDAGGPGKWHGGAGEDGSSGKKKKGRRGGGKKDLKERLKQGANNIRGWSNRETEDLIDRKLSQKKTP